MLLILNRIKKLSILVFIVFIFQSENNNAACGNKGNIYGVVRIPSNK